MGHKIIRSEILSISVISDEAWKNNESATLVGNYLQIYQRAYPLPAFLIGRQISSSFPKGSQLY